MSIPLQELFEEFNHRIDKPIEYNHLLTSIFHELYGMLAPNTITFIDGVPYVLDTVRGYQLSLPRAVINAGWYGQNVKNRYLKLASVTTIGTGFVVPRDAVITGLWAKSRNLSNWTIEVRRNNIPITLVSTPVVSGIGYDGDISFLLDEGDYIQFYAAGSTIDHPIASVEMAWRIAP